MAASILPRNFSLSVTQDITTTATTTTTRTNRFLEIEHEAVASHGLFIAKGDQIPNPFSMLEPVNAGSGRVHLRCCYNNKYLSIRSETDHRITPEADEPVEDQSSWNCTMFTVTTNQSTGRTRVEHVHLGRRVVAMEPDRILTIDQNQTTEFDDFAVHDVSAILALNLPPFFTLKDFNGKYAQTIPDDVIGAIIFSTNVNDFNPIFVYEILSVDVGLIRIRSLIADRCWRSDLVDDEGEGIKIILADTSVDLANLPPDHNWWDGFFNVQRMINANDDNVVAISHSDSGAPMWLTSLAGIILFAIPRDVNTPPTADARFVMEAAIRARSIYNVRYNVLAARLLLGQPESMSTQTMYNSSSLPQIFERTFSFMETTTTRWNATVTASISVEVSVSMGIPVVASGSITTTYQISGAYEWGTDHTTSVTKEDSITITVPPMTTVAVSRWESHGSYDIPFSYTQEDTLCSGNKVVTERHDGLAIGMNNQDIFYNVVETPMGPSTKAQEAREYRIVPTTSRIVSTPNNPSPASFSDWVLQQPEDTFPALNALRKYVSNRLTSK